MLIVQPLGLRAIQEINDPKCWDTKEIVDGSAFVRLRQSWLRLLPLGVLPPIVLKPLCQLQSPPTSGQGQSGR
ncbi:MAG: hypothetical protein HWQ38_10860 [Nostoc sp. NMS7]|uniref:hypothetical protein n=1 Tax=Nostoc sp. NMS7 TaxID=2815391 RepID=UPI0025FBA5B3|nr:hypothetical protein [Nostoc sp. NMS7]MBN3946957.1 hypothetical protein [Nostoc sp. NMS7]